MTPDEAEYVDGMGLFCEQVGGPRTMGRICGWLMICDPPDQSLGELAAVLEVSKPAISTAIRPMRDIGLVDRIPTATREHRYRLSGGGFPQLLLMQLGTMRAGVAAAERGLATLGDGRSQQRAQLEEFRDFCAFVASEFRENLERQWDEYRRKGSGDDDEG